MSLKFVSYSTLVVIINVVLIKPQNSIANLSQNKAGYERGVDSVIINKTVNSSRACDSGMICGDKGNCCEEGETCISTRCCSEKDSCGNACCDDADQICCGTACCAKSQCGPLPEVGLTFICRSIRDENLNVSK